MKSNEVRPDDRETLSALFDGELDGEARLFASRRLGHDTAWQATCGRWQAIGDAMRRQAPIAAPAGFAEGVAAAVASERPMAPRVAARPTSEPSRVRRMRWVGGGALAASLALAMVVSLSTTGPATQDPATVVATAPAPEQATPAPSVPATGIASAEGTAPVAALAAAADPESTARGVSAVAPPRRPRPSAASVVASRVDVAPAVAEAALQAGQSGNPFNLTGDEALTARPWPRATLGTGATSFTARYGAAGESAAERPSFYPFEPRPQGEPETVPTP